MFMKEDKKEVNSVIPPHPIQPLMDDGKGVVRFKENKIVSYLLDNGGIDLNKIAKLDFSREDREQFAQLIGYSHSGASDLWYVSDCVLKVSEQIYEEKKNNKDQKDVIILHLQTRLKELREKLAEALADFFEICPEDLKGYE